MPLNDVRFTDHARRRMSKRGITDDDVRHVLASGSVIEDYPNTLPYPSYLMLGWSAGRPLHSVATDNLALQATLVITAYEPDPLAWDAAFRLRIAKN
jgi:hypothetical protein